MDLIVTADTPDATQDPLQKDPVQKGPVQKGPVQKGWATLGAQRFRCALGRGGILKDKREGDGGTPIGAFALRRLLVRDDKGATPATKLPITHIEEDDGWCDAPDDIAYNHPVALPYPASHERLWRDDHLYDLVLVIGHNDDPVVSGQGSAVFVHLAHEDYRPTEGCIAFKREDLEEILSVMGPGDRVIVEGP